ncbi:MAG TPA: PAS domain S-box protein, partial [Terriglobales bacterium]
IYEPTDLASITSEIASAFRSAIENAGLRFSVECQPIAEPIYVDRDMWEKVVSNLLSNAFKFTFEGEVALTLKPVDGAVELQVRDTGVGIPEEHRERIFERFHRIEGTHARTYEGAGIGLALVQELVKLHGGSLRVESAVGHGSTFTVTIPRGSAHLPAERIQAARSLASSAVATGAYAEEALRWLPSDWGSEPPAGRVPKTVSLPSLSRSETAPGRETILIADDNADMRQFLKRLLDDRYEVHAVAEGRAALEFTRRLHPGLVLADVMMPRLDGFGLLRAIREDSSLASTPVILLSARAGEESRVEGLQAGADDYLVKPFAARELLARVEAHLKMSNLRRETAEREERLRGQAELERQKLRASEERLAETSRLYVELQNREAKIRRLVEANVVGIVVGNLEGRILEANDAFLRIVGYDREDLASGRLRWTDLTPPEWRDRDEAAIAELNAKGVFQPFEKEYFRKDGGRVPVLQGGALFEDRGNEGVAFILDLSEQKRAERALRRSEERWRSVFENSAIGVALSDLNGRFIATNPVYKKMLGYTGEELQNLTFLDITVEEFRDRWSLIGDLLEGKVQQFQLEKRYRRKDGSQVWVHNNVSVVPGTERVPQFLMALSEDITERKLAEEALKLQVQVLQNIPVNAWTVLPDGTQDFTNQQWLEYTGLTLDRFLSSPQAWMTALHPDDHERAAAAFWGGIRSGGAFTSETRFRRVSDGEYRWHLNRGIPLRDSGGNLIKFVGTSTDIEDVKRAEEALRASEQELRLIVDTIPGMVCMLKADWEVEFVNKPLREYFGKMLEELKNWEFIGVVHPDDIERVVDKTRRSTTTGEPYGVEHRCLRHDGVFRWFQVRAMPL